MQHAAVETRVVGGDERRVVEPGAERRPQIGEGRRVAYVVPAQTVEAGEREPCDWRPDQVGSGQDDPAAAAGSESDRAGAVAADGGGLEVDRDERSRRRRLNGKRRGLNRGWAEEGNEGNVVEAWGKFDETSRRIHRLEHHCADVGACFEELLKDEVLNRRFAAAAGQKRLDPNTAARLAALAFLHDFGKLNAGFQFKIEHHPVPGEERERKPSRAGHVSEALLAFGRDDVCDTLGLYRMCEEWGEGVEPLLYAALAHHGRPAERPTQTGKGPANLWKPFAGYDPLATARLLNERAHRWFPDAFASGPPLPDTPALAHLFAGTVAIADQLGSKEDDFKYEQALELDYIERARRIAARVVQGTLFRRAGWNTNAAAADVRSLFGYATPRPCQRDVSAAPTDRPLLILESETGSGKTEAAILRFVALWREGLVDGLYFAVPTRAAAKQLHVRVGKALTRLIPPDAQVETVLAVPGYHRAGDAEGERIGRFDVFWKDEPGERKRLARWSAESARKFLASPAAVGTVDQVLLAGLRVKWAHFRAASLARSLLVVDEVHASDAYMTRVLRGVLQGHLAIGGHALLMSATLGSAARSGFVSESPRSSPPAPEDAERVPYPALTLARGGTPPETRAIDTDDSSKSVKMTGEPILEDPNAIATAALAAAREGAKVLVIRNTVTSAQAVFEALTAQGGEDVVLKVADQPTLHHSRFAAEDRHRLDEAVERMLGKTDRPRGGAVVIGTQTLEQSLDIDADLLITDVCPVDVLLQRIGRLRRHRETSRPAGFGEPRCCVLLPKAGVEAGLDGTLLRHGLGMTERGGVYENLLSVEATRGLIASHPRWTIPAMNRLLVEQATHPDVLSKLPGTEDERWRRHRESVTGRHAAKTVLAKNHALTRAEKFDEELVFPDIDERVRTRLGEDGPRIVLANPVRGPFGKEVKTFNLPAYWFRGALPTKDEIDAARAEPGHDDDLLLRIGDRTLIYDRAGVRRSDA